MDASSKGLGFLLCIALVLCSAWANTAVKVRMSEKVLQEAANEVVGRMDLDGKTLNDVGSGSFRLTGIRVLSFTKPAAEVEITSTHGVGIDAKGAGIQVSGNWRYRYKIWFFTGTLRGGVTVTASGVDADVSAIVGRRSDGRPSISASGCSGNVGSLSFRFTGSLSGFLNLFSRIVTNLLRPRLDDMMCDQITKVVNGQFNDELAEIKVMYPVGQNTLLDYTLTDAPDFQDGHVDAKIKGTFSLSGSPSTLTPSSVTFAEPSNPNKMVYIWGTDHVINSFLQTAYLKNLARITYTLNNLPQLNLNSPVTISLAATQAPSISITPSGIKLNMMGTVAIQNGDQTWLQLAIIINTGVFVRVEGTTLKGNITHFIPEISVISSIVPVPEDELQNVFETAIGGFILDQINQLGEKGMPLPSLKDWRFENTVIALNEGHILICTDIERYK